MQPHDPMNANDPPIQSLSQGEISFLALRPTPENPGILELSLDPSALNAPGNEFFAHTCLVRSLAGGTHMVFAQVDPTSPTQAGASVCIAMNSRMAAQFHSSFNAHFRQVLRDALLPQHSPVSFPIGLTTSQMRVLSATVALAKVHETGCHVDFYLIPNVTTPSDRVPVRSVVRVLCNHPTLEQFISGLDSIHSAHRA